MEDNLSKLQSAAATQVFSAYEKLIIGILAFLQFTIVLDFMIMSPLGAVLMPALKMTTSQFGYVVSAYAFSAGIAGFMSAGFADRFDRKKLLLFFYAGFLIGTFLCGIAPSYEFLFGARMITGLFGGVIGSVVLAIATDLFAYERRGRVMGYVQTAFAASQILGIPIGLFISNHWGWHMPFMFIVGLGVLAGVVIIFKMQPVDTHLHLIKIKHNPFKNLFKTLINLNYFTAFVTTALMSLGGFLLMPFMSAFTVNNVGISLEKLPLIYFVTGVSSIFMGPIIGRLSDKYGKFKVFFAGAILTAITVLIYTHLGITPLWVLMLVNVVLFASIFMRMIPSQALISAIPEPNNRGAFMAVNSSMAQVAGGIASVIAGLIVVEGADGKLIHFNYLNYFLTCTVMFSVYMMYRISRYVEKSQKKN